MTEALGLLAGLFDTALGIVVFVAIALWSLVWKLVALDRAASRGDKVWFVVIFFLNTLGILEILYMAFFSQKRSYRPRR